VSAPLAVLPAPRRACCPRCDRPLVVCVCRHVTPLPTRTQVLLLQHPREARVGVGTARLAHLALPRNEGFAVAMNRGVARTRAPFVLALNADTVLEPGAIEALATALAADPGLGGVQPRILQVEGGAPGDPAGVRLYSAGMALTRDGRAYEIGAGRAQTAADHEAREVFGVCGAACLLRRQLFSELGGYDESYFAFYEDVDLNVRARIAGWRFAYEPASVVWHAGNASWLAGAGGIALLALALNTGAALPIYWSLVFGSGRRLDRLREAWSGYWVLFRGLVIPACALFGLVVFRLLAAG